MTTTARENRLRLGTLLRRARKELGLRQELMAKAYKTDARTLRRWESGETRPARAWRELIAITLGNVDGETWRAIVGELGLSLDAALARVPSQGAKLVPPPPPSPPASPKITPDAARALFDDAVRATAEELDVSARRLRAALASILADVERLELSPREAREIIQGRSAARVMR